MPLNVRVLIGTNACPSPPPLSRCDSSCQSLVVLPPTGIPRPFPVSLFADSASCQQMSDADQSFNPELRQVLVVIGKHLIRDQVGTSAASCDVWWFAMEIERDRVVVVGPVYIP